METMLITIFCNDLGYNAESDNKLVGRGGTAVSALNHFFKQNNIPVTIEIEE